jgi:hypothetical protein
VSKATQKKAEKLYIEDNWEHPALAKKFKVSERTIRRWADAGNWKTKRVIDTIASHALAEEVSEQLDKPIPPQSVRVAMKGLDRSQLFETAIASLYAVAPDAGIKSQEAAYGQMVKIMQTQQQMEHNDRLADIEVKLKQLQLEKVRYEVEKERYETQLKQWQVKPPDPEALVDMALDFGIPLAEVVKRMMARLDQLA